MKKFILGKKIGMTTIYGDEKEALNVTLVECPENKVSLVRTSEKDKYAAVQLSIAKTKNKNISCEFRTEENKFKTGDVVKTDIFSIGEKVNVSGQGKAKGFQGGVKRHGFGGSPKTHGHKHDLRAPGSVGAQQPQHVIKGKRMAGRMGGKKVTSRNVKIVFIDSEKNILGLKGAVPGVPGGIIEIYAK